LFALGYVRKDLIRAAGEILIAAKTQIMSLRLLAVCATLLSGWVLGAIAGGSSAGSGAQIAPTDNSSVSTYKVTDTSVGASARESAGASTSQPGSSTSESASSGNASSSNGSGSSAGPRDNTVSEGSSARSGNANEISKEIAREKVIDTGDKAVETEKPAKAEPRDKTFAPHLLDTVSDISAVGAQKEQGSRSKTDQSKSTGSENKNDSHK
jgi:hypothetical protein